MDFQLTEEDQLLADSVARLVEKDYAFETRKAILASDPGYSATFFASMADMGLLALSLPQAHGGFGLGTLALKPVMEALGRGLVVEPLASTLVAARLLASLGTMAQQAQWLTAIAGGQARIALAHGEPGSRYTVSHVATQARTDGSGWVLEGEKSMVLGGPQSERLLVSARLSGDTSQAGGIALFIVDPDAAGVDVRSLRTVDGFRAADVSLRGVRVDSAARVGDGADALDAIDEAIDFATLLACAEAIGAMHDANDATLEYLKTRKQFGAPIGSFQALQHRMVDMTVSQRQADSIVLLACGQFDDAAAGRISASQRRRIVSAAKVKVADACRHVGQEAIQLHGGMGLTVEMKVGHTFKRLTMISQIFGDADYHLARFAREDRAA